MEPVCSALLFKFSGCCVIGISSQGICERKAQIDKMKFYIIDQSPGNFWIRALQWNGVCNIKVLCLVFHIIPICTNCVCIKPCSTVSGIDPGKFPEIESVVRHPHHPYLCTADYRSLDPVEDQYFVFIKGCVEAGSPCKVFLTDYRCQHFSINTPVLHFPDICQN